MVDLLSYAASLHASHHGISDPLPASREREMVADILARLADWRPSPPQCAAYDAAVRTLLLAALWERGIDA